MGTRGYKKTIIRFKVERLLSPEHWAEYRELLKDRRSTVRSLHAWIIARGYKIGPAAVARHRRRFDGDFESVRRTALLAEQLAEAAAPAGPLGAGALADATVARFQQMLLERLLKLDKEEHPGGIATTRDFNTREWLELSKTITETVNARRNLESLRAEYEKRHRQAVAAVEKAAAGSKSKVVNGVEIANCVRRILGVPLDGEPVPDQVDPLFSAEELSGGEGEGGDPVLRRVEWAVEETMRDRTRNDNPGEN
jgi:hypothetical protein